MLDAKMVNDWCINYGLDSRTPHEAAEWWATTVGMAPSGAVAALGLCLEEIATATRERDEARALNAQWAEKAATWTASPEAAQRLQGYRDLAQQVAAAQNERDEARAEVAEIESVLRASGSLNQKLLDEVDRLRALTICGCGDHFNAAFRGLCPNCVAAGKVAP